MTAARRRWRTTLDRAIFVSILVLGSSLSAAASPSLMAAAGDHGSGTSLAAPRVAHDTHVLSAPGDATQSSDPFDTDDDQDDDGGDGFAVAIIDAPPNVLRDSTAARVCDGPADRLISAASGTHSLRAPPR